MASMSSSSLQFSRAGATIRLPPPHRLGRANTEKTQIQVVEDDGSVEEVDYGEEVEKVDLQRSRKRSSTTSVASAFKLLKLSLPDSSAQSVFTCDGEPLHEYGVYIPEWLPEAITSDPSTLQSYVIAATETFITINRFSEHLEVVDLRLPSELKQNALKSTSFVSRLVSSVMTSLKGVSSIGQLTLPNLQLKTAQQFAQAVAPLAHEGVPCIKSISIIIDNRSMSSTETHHCNVALQTLSNAKLKNLILVSQSPAASKLQDMLVCNQTKIKISTSSEMMEPFFSQEAEDEDEMEEQPVPHSYLSCLNLASVKDSPSPLASKSHKVQTITKRKARPKSSFLSDRCVSKKSCDELTSDDSIASNIWELDELHASGIDGSGTTIAVLDSGINYIHPAFKDKIILVKNFVPGKINNFDSVIDSDGHGSLCAGIAAGSSFNRPKESEPRTVTVPSGAAPAAKLIICKVVDTEKGEASNKAINDALAWLKEIHEAGTSIDVVSISLAASYFSKQQASLISELTNLDVIVVCCASNEGRMRFQPISFPGRLGQVLCIGAHDENGKPTSFSPVGRELDFLGPGKDVWGPGPGSSGPFAMDCASGTSCATPAVAGLVCLVLQRVRAMAARHPHKYRIGSRSVYQCVRNVWVMRELLREMGSSPGHHSEEIGHGTLDPSRLLDRNDDELFRLIDSIVEDE